MVIFHGYVSHNQMVIFCITHINWGYSIYTIAITRFQNVYYGLYDDTTSINIWQYYSDMDASTWKNRSLWDSSSY